MTKTLHPYLDMERPMVLAHRGDSRHAPENTLPAFELAAQAGVDALETDVQWTKDGVIVVCHDDSVDRTSNGQGAIEDMTYKELQELDFGYHFTPDEGETFPYRGRGVKILRFRDVMTLFPGLRINVDIKTQHPHSVQQFIREVYECKAETRVLAASFHDRVLKQFRSMNQVIATSASTLETANFWCRVWLHLPAPSKLSYCALQVPMNGYGMPVVTPAFVKRAHESQLKVHVWTIDDEELIKSLFDMGVDGIVTNDPCLAVRVRDEHTLTRSA
jgi:glycerophosphoryl diester phosphodiesterase